MTMTDGTNDAEFLQKHVSVPKLASLGSASLVKEIRTAGEKKAMIRSEQKTGL